MTTFTLSPLRLTLLSLVGSAIVAGGALVAVIALWQPTPLEGMLPAQGTMAMFGSATREDLRLFTGRFPSLQSVPLYEGRLSAAVMLLPTGKEVWVLAPHTKESGVEENIRVGRQGFVASDETVQAVLADGSPRLRTTDAFTRLLRGMNRAGQWVFLNEHARSQSVTPPALEKIMNGTGAALLSLARGAVTLRLLGGSDWAAEETLSRPLPELSPPPDTTIAFGNPTEMIDHVSMLFAEPQRTLKMALLRSKAQELLGGDWSWTYDILPLLTQESSLSWTTADEGTPFFLLTGGMTNVRDGRARLDAIHERVRSKLTGSTVVRRNFEKGLTSAVLRSDPAQVEDVRENRNGWAVHITRERTGSGMLLSAQRGTQFILTNHAGWLGNAVAADKALTPFSPLGRPMAGGTVSLPLAREWSTSVAATPEWTWMWKHLNARESVLWALESDGQGETLSLTLSGL